MTDRIGDVITLVGALFVLLAAVGVVRFGDALARMHAAAKASTLGLVLVGIGAAIRIGTAAAIATVVLVIVLQLVASPIGGHVIARAVYRGSTTPDIGVDELAESEDT